jgi:dihydrofolate reductase
VSKIIMFNMVTLDGFFEGPNRDIDWHRVDEEFNDFAIEQVKTADGLIFGRVTYELMTSYWPTADALSNDPQIAEKMNTISKIVFSRTLDRADWNNTRLIKGEAVEEVRRLKQQTGGNLFIFGSADLSSSLIPQGLIDEFRLMLNPVVLGSGNPLFRDKLNLKLLETRTFQNGNVLLYYQPAS